MKKLLIVLSLFILSCEHAPEKNYRKIYSNIDAMTSDQSEVFYDVDIYFKDSITKDIESELGQVVRSRTVLFNKSDFNDKRTFIETEVRSSIEEYLLLDDSLKNYKLINISIGKIIER